MNTNKHKYSVSTAQPAKLFKEKFKEWENILVGEDQHSIRNQIYEMMFDSVFFQCINESRKYAAKDDKGNIKQNKMIHYFINQSFFKTQLLSIRRLKDKRSDVYSLRRLIKDIKKNSALLTRKNILDAYNLPYDYEKAMEYLRQNTEALGKVLNAHKIICETASFIGNNLLFCGFGVFLQGPRYGQFDQFDIFEYLNERIASKETIEKLREFWEKYQAETEQWHK